MTADLYPIPTPAPGRLMILARPRGGDWLDDEIAAWQRSGVSDVVSMLTADEETVLELTAERTLCHTRGLQFWSVPVPDRSVPAESLSFLQTARELAHTVRSGGKIGIHCRQGIGRSAVLAVAVLSALGVDMKDAIGAVSSARGVPVPETPEQRQWLLTFARVNRGSAA